MESGVTMAVKGIAVSRYKKVASGELVTINGQSAKWMCCDCGLVHVIRFEATGDHSLRMWRDNRATAARRRRGKKRVAKR